MKNHLINKIAICVSAVFSVLSLTACPAFLSETFGTFSNMEKVSSMPGTNYQWEETTLDNAKNLWKVTPDMNSKKNVYKHADVYEKESDGIYKYSNCYIDCYSNIYKDLGVKYNYVISYGVTEITLNKISPTVKGMEDAKIYKTSETGYLKFVKGDITYILKNGWLVEYKDNNRHVYVSYID